MKNPKREMWLQLCPGRVVAPILHHNILRVVLKTGKTYAVDVAGAQFGFHDPVLPWEDFDSERLATTTKVQDFGTMASTLAKWTSLGDPVLMTNMYNANTIGHAQDEALSRWLTSKDTKLTSVLRLKPGDYALERSILLETLSKETFNFVRSGVKTKELFVACETKFGKGMMRFTLTRGDGSELEMFPCC